MRLKGNDFRHFVSNQKVAHVWVRWVSLWDGIGRTGVHANSGKAELQRLLHSEVATYSDIAKVAACIADGGS